MARQVAEGATEGRQPAALRKESHERV